MIDQIKILTEQITDFLADKDGFSTEVKMHGVSLDVTAPNGETTNYDMYEILLYTLAVRKLGSDIELKIEIDSGGNPPVIPHSDHLPDWLLDGFGVE